MNALWMQSLQLLATVRQDQTLPAHVKAAGMTIGYDAMSYYCDHWLRSAVVAGIMAAKRNLP